MGPWNLPLTQYGLSMGAYNAKSGISNQTLAQPSHKLNSERFACDCQTSLPGFEPLWYLSLLCKHPSTWSFDVPTSEWSSNQLRQEHLGDSWALYKYNHSALTDISWQHPRRTQWSWVHNGISGGKCTSYLKKVKLSVIQNLKSKIFQGFRNLV